MFSSSVNLETNIRVGKDFLIKIPFNSENVEDEEFYFSCMMKLPLHPEHAEEENNNSFTSVKEF